LGVNQDLTGLNPVEEQNVVHNNTFGQQAINRVPAQGGVPAFANAWSGVANFSPEPAGEEFLTYELVYFFW
jgi:hypothetical protein